MLKLLFWSMILVWGGQSILLFLLFTYQLLKENRAGTDTVEPPSVDPQSVDIGAATTVKVTTVLHGDTIQIEINGEQQVVRLADIDCPASERDDRPFGAEAKQFTSVHCLDRSVQIVPTGQQDDRWTVLLPNGECLQHELVRHGLAWHVRKDSDSAEELEALQDEAKAKRVGIWSQSEDAE